MLDGRIAVVTGGASGIGLMSALGLSKAGAAVAIFDLDGEAAERAAQQINDAGGTGSAHQADCGKVADLERVVAEVAERYDQVDILLNNAGMPNPHGINDITEEQWERSIAVNLKSGFFATKLLLPLMRKTGRGGSIIFTASAAGLVGSYTTPLYSLTKFGVVGLTKSLAIHLAPENIRVNAVCPGPVDTPMLPGFMGRGPEGRDEVAELYSSRVPLSRVARPEEIADAVVYLASDAASYITGVPLPVDGGYVAQ